MPPKPPFILPFHIYGIMNSSNLFARVDSLKIKNSDIFCEDIYYTSRCSIHPHLKVEHACNLLTKLELDNINVDCFGLLE